MLEPIQHRYRELMNDPGELQRLLNIGANRAQEQAAATLSRAYEAIGLLPAEATPSSLSRQHVDRRLFRLALPALGTLAVEPLYVATDTAIIGRVGAEELAGLAAAGTILALIVAGTNFLAYGTTERIASARGAQNEARSGALRNTHSCLASSSACWRVQHSFPWPRRSFLYSARVQRPHHTALDISRLRHSGCQQSLSWLQPKVSCGVMPIIDGRSSC